MIVFGCFFEVHRLTFLFSFGTLLLIRIGMDHFSPSNFHTGHIRPNWIILGIAKNLKDIWFTLLSRLNIASTTYSASPTCIINLCNEHNPILMVKYHLCDNS